MRPSPFGLRASLGRTSRSRIRFPGVGSRRWISSTLRSGLPSMASSTSPCRTPARAAGPAGTTLTACTAVGGSNKCARWKRRETGKSWQPSPRKERRTCPWASSSDTTHCAVADGTEKERFCAPWMIAVLMPTTREAESTSGPPELPGLIAASVCMKLTFLFGMPTSAAERDSDEMMPSVTVESSPTALPMAIAQSPTCSSSERPSGAVGSGFPDGLMRMAAKSMKSSVPLTRPSNVRPSMRVTVTLAAFFTTWALVMMSPSSDRMTPEPCPDSRRCPSPSPPRSGKRYPSSAGRSTSRSVSMRTTEGPTACTAAVTNDVFRRAPPTGVGGSRPGSRRLTDGNPVSTVDGAAPAAASAQAAAEEEACAADERP
mmetsp:Transcript_20262/g.68549  ORF Transcript_20262/g.68549 Transcript_20262/m.68549 type:complete len:373 (-) Transcript_20262:418-1536(-)